MEKTDPIISVQTSVYALDGDVRPAVYTFLETLDSTGIDRETGTLSTVVWGEADAVWEALRIAYEATATKHPVIVNTTRSRAAGLR